MMAKMIATLLLVFNCIAMAYSQTPSPNIAPLPMHLYQVQGSGGDTACSSTVNLQQLTQARQLALKRYSDLKEAESFKAYETGMRALWDPTDSNISINVPAAGTYFGIEEIIEYVALVVGVANDGYSSFYDAKISNFEYFPNNASYAFTVNQKAKFYCRRAPSATDDGDCQTGEIDVIALHHVSFKPCSTLFKQYVLAYDDYTTYLAAKGARLITICMRHDRHCNTPQTRQFQDVFACMKYYESIPFATCGKEVFNGNNALCRFKHSFMVKFRPNEHCPHIGRNSEPCTDADCDGDFRACTDKPGEVAYTPRLSPRCCLRPYCVTRTRCAWNRVFEFNEKRCKVKRLYGRRHRIMKLRFRKLMW